MYHTTCFSAKQTPTSLDLLPLPLTGVLWTMSAFQAKMQPLKLFINIFLSFYLQSHPHFCILSSPLQCSPFTRLLCLVPFWQMLQKAVEQLAAVGLFSHPFPPSLFFPCPCICIKGVTDEDPIVHSYIYILGKKTHLRQEVQTEISRSPCSKVYIMDYITWTWSATLVKIKANVIDKRDTVAKGL